MTGENIICFSKDWSEEPTSNNHVMIELARSNRVLWVNSIATRAPKLTSGRDLAKIFKKARDFTRGAQQVQENLWVYTPAVVPLPHSRVATAVNQRILRASLNMLRRSLGMDEFQLWTFLPSAAEYVGKLGESVSVYYCVDEWGKFNYVDGGRVAEAERSLCGRVDIVFATAQSLVDRRLSWNPRTHLARHGVDHALFSRALDGKTAVPKDIADLPGPIIGMYGTLQDWVDYKLIAHLAQAHPEWSIVLIGKQMVDLSALQHYRNVHILGRRTHSTLPEYCKGFSVGIIPYVMNDRIHHVNPIKLREYLCAGLPVVSTPLPEVQCYAKYCRITGDFEQFRREVEEAIKTDTPQLHRERSQAMLGETWERKVAEVGEQVMRVKRQKQTN